MSADRELPPDGETEGEEVDGSAYEDVEPDPVDDSDAAPVPDIQRQRDKR